jgi:dihydrofolate reductase/thymidylate synthase
MIPIHLIAAVGASDEYGLEGRLPWGRLEADLKHFSHVTRRTTDPGRRNAVIMGRGTWVSIPSTYRPLPGRLNIVISSQLKVSGDHPDLMVVRSLEEALKAIDTHGSVETGFMIGGPSLMVKIVKSYPHRCERLFLTRIHANFIADVYFPTNQILQIFGPERSATPIVDPPTKIEFTISTYENPTYESARATSSSSSLSSSLSSPHEEYQYLNLIREILAVGIPRGDRTGVGTLAVFGKQMKFSLRNGQFPLLTTKQTFFRGIAEELFWFISGSTNANILGAKGVHIWDANGSRDFLDARGFTDRAVGDLGPVYGYQWRHFGAPYKDMDTDYTGQGIDQLADVIDKIKRNPTDRRIIMSAWNPADLHLMALPPCHMFVQFFVANGELSSLLYQRSCDMGLGVPFNIASYALLTCMIAHVCGLKPGDFIHTLGDTHIYLNHIDPIREQLQREPFPFPRIELDPAITSIDAFRWEHIKLHNYRSHPRIKMEMAL